MQWKKLVLIESKWNVNPEEPEKPDPNPKSFNRIKVKCKLSKVEIFAQALGGFNRIKVGLRYNRDTEEKAW